jgi:2-methylcitrate dehydratase PrpD
MNLSQQSNGARTAEFIASTAERGHAAEVMEAARMCLVDWCGCALGAFDEPAAQSVRRMAAGWGATGAAPMLRNGTTSPLLSALVNGTMAHCLDFDDTHVGSLAHLSGPTWAAVLALAADQRLSGIAALECFITGFEVGARLGGDDIGEALTARGFHSTGVIGKLAAAAAASAALGLNPEQAANAMALAGTQAAGLTGSFGTMAKPLHAGKSGMDGVLSAQLASQGFDGAETLLEEEGGLVEAMIQDGAARRGPVSYTAGEELLRNTFKPYASCLLTHPAIDAARQLASEINETPVQKLVLDIHPLAKQVAGKPVPTTGLEGKFSLAYCVALGLNGHPANAADFSPARLAEQEMQTMVERLEVRTTAEMDKRAAALEAVLADGRTLRAEVPLALGNPGNPMSRQHMEDKFMPLAEPVMGAEARELLHTLMEIEAPGALERALGLLAGGRDPV